MTPPSMETSTKMHLPELSTVIHVVRKQIKCILVNERPRDISLARLRDVYQSVNGRTRNTIFAGTRKAKARNNFAQKLIRSTCVQSDSHLSVKPLDRNIISTTNLVHRRSNILSIHFLTRL